MFGEFLVAEMSDDVGGEEETEDGEEGEWEEHDGDRISLVSVRDV